MEKTSYYVIKKSAKAKMQGHFGETFLALALIPFVLSMGNSIISTSLIKYETITNIIQFLIAVLISYITIMLSLKLSKGKYRDLFSNLFGNSKGYLNVLIYRFIITLFTIIPLLLYIDFFDKLTNYFANLPLDYVFDSNELGNVMIGFLPSNTLIIISIVSLFLGFIINIKLFFTPYLIVDKDIKAIDALKLSWKYTNGNFFRVLFFPLSFILWYLLIFVTFGLILIYVIPYTKLSYAVFYNHILKENGDFIKDDAEKSVVNDSSNSKKNEIEYDPLDDF